MSWITSISITAVYLFCFVSAIPWEGFTARSSLGSDLSIPGATSVEAHGVYYQRKYREVAGRDYLSVSGQEGATGRAILHHANPPLYYINQNKLWQYTNDSYILPVNVVNATLTAEAPLQVVVGKGDKSVSGGIWSWVGSKLVYEKGHQQNRGLFYSCVDKMGVRGVYMALEPVQPPTGCYVVTLHATDRI